MNLGILLVGLISALAVMAVFVGIYLVVERANDLQERLEAYAGRVRQKGQPGSREQRGVTSLARLLERFLSGRALVDRLALRLIQAGARLTVSEFLMIVLAAGAIGAAVGFLLQRQLISSVAGSALAVLVPWILVERHRQRRIKAFHDQLIDVVVLIVGSLRSGHGLRNGLDLVAKEMSPPASEEFGRVLREIGFGVSQTEALNNLVRRMESDDLQLMVTAINISHEVGGNLSLVLEKIADTLRERIRLHGEIRVLTTQQRLTSYLLVALPFFLGVAMALLNPGYILRLFRPQWILIPAGALVSEIIGFFITRRIVRIRV